MKNIFRYLTAAIAVAAASAMAQEPAAPDAAQAAPAEAQAGTFSLKERDLIRALAADLAADLLESSVPSNAPLAILPIIDDRADFAYGLFKTAGTDAKRNVVEGRNDQMWETIVSETAWNQRKGSVGVLDEATLTAFGKLQAANLLLYGNVLATTKPVLFGFFKLTRVEAELHVSSVNTKQHLWGRSYVRQEAIPWKILTIAAAVVLLILIAFVRATTRVR